MKTPSQDLFNFIHSMSSSEKRYFKKDTRDSNTLDLFDIINEMDSYDEEVVKNRLNDSSYAGNLKVHKNRLQQILLKNLRSFYEEKSAQSKIKVLIENSEIYIRKKLFDQALSQLDKAILLCDNYEEFELKLQALGIKSRLSSYFTELDSFEETPILEMEKCSRQIHNYIQHAIVNKKILHYLNTACIGKSSSENSTWINNLIEAEIIQKEEAPLSTIAERMYLHSQALLADTAGDLQKACALTKKNVERFEDNLYIVEEKNAQYLNTIINYLDLCSRLPGAVHEVERFVTKAEKHSSVYEHLMPSMLYVYISYAEALKHACNYQKLIAVYETKIKVLSENYFLEETYLALKAMAYCVEAYIATGDYDSAGEMIRNVLNAKNQLPIDLKYAVLILELMYHYDRSDFMFLDNLINAFQKKLKKSERNSLFAEKLLVLFKKLSASDISEHKSLLQLFRTSVSLHEEDPIYRQLDQLISLSVWMDAHIRKQPYLLLLKEKQRNLDLLS
jgi:hypothetical protein